MTVAAVMCRHLPEAEHFLIEPGRGLQVIHLQCNVDDLAGHLEFSSGNFEKL
jgi:hypothetical protein